MEDKLLQILNGEVPDTDWVLETRQRHPAFYLPAALLLRSAAKLDTDTRNMLQQAVIVNCSDRMALADLVDLGETDWASIYPRTDSHQKDTVQTIDTFINTYGPANAADENAVLERLLFNPTPPDYFSGTDEPFDPNDPLALPPELIPGHAKNQPEQPILAEQPEPEVAVDVEPEITAVESVPVAVVETPANPKPKTQSAQKPKPSQKNEHEQGSDATLMESLAKFFIKQRRYSRAFEIISKLSLNYPEKSVYFADQLRFLKKLMINQQVLQEKTPN